MKNDKKLGYYQLYKDCYEASRKKKICKLVDRRNDQCYLRQEGTEHKNIGLNALNQRLNKKNYL